MREKIKHISRVTYKKNMAEGTARLLKCTSKTWFSM